jgi:hypothetical protein
MNDDGFRGILALREQPDADGKEKMREYREYLNAFRQRFQQFIVPGAERLFTIKSVVPVGPIDTNDDLMMSGMESQLAEMRALVDLADNVTSEEKEWLKAQLVPENMGRIVRHHSGGIPSQDGTFTFEGDMPIYNDTHGYIGHGGIGEAPAARSGTATNNIECTCDCSPWSPHEEWCALPPCGNEHCKICVRRLSGAADAAHGQEQPRAGRGIVRFSSEDAVPWFEMELREALEAVEPLAGIESDGPHVVVQACGTDDEVGERLYLAALWWASTTRLVDGATVERVHVRQRGDVGVVVTRVE